MNRVLVLCPAAFRSYSKLCRKLDFLLQNLDGVQLCAPDDQHDMLDRYCDEHRLPLARLPLHGLLMASDDQSNPDAPDGATVMSAITHAVVFDDGEEFPQALAQLRQRPIRIRRVPVRITRVVNIRRETEYASQKSTPAYEYIGRGSYWGNPYSMYEEGENPRDRQRSRCQR